MDKTTPAQEEKILLTIAIPTYNRAGYLDECLNHICSQLKGYEDRVELVVSDNCSTDSTGEVVQRYIDKSYPVIYRRNPENIGSDNNFIKCFKEARGKYVLIMGDDDILLDDAIRIIMEVLSGKDYGLIYLNAYPFSDDYISQKPLAKYKGFEIYNDKSLFLKKSGYLMFISTWIVNKNIIENADDLEKYYVENLVHMSWILSVFLKSEKNVIIWQYVIAARLFNSGGYELTKVFAVRLNKVFNMFIVNGFNRKYFDIINRKMLIKFFPSHISKIKSGKLILHRENIYKNLYPVYRTYLYFWIFTVPMIILPAAIAYRIFKIGDRIRRMKWLLQSWYWNIKYKGL
jgi:abequosyltransferase